MSLRIRRTAAALVVTLLAGCSGLEGKPDTFEYAYHGLNLIDTGQTIHIAREPDCYYEKGFPTKEILGRHPDQEEVYAIMLTYSAIFHYTNRWLDNKARKSYADQDGHHKKWQWARGIFNVSSFAFKMDTVKNNHDQGIRPWGRGC